MKLKLYFLFLILGAMSLQSCDNDDDDAITVPPLIQNALADKYPGATRIEWETETGYYVADFYNNGYEISAWFSPEGIWHKTETDIPYTALPELVQVAFQKEYSAWRVDDVDKVERNEAETVYVIEIEKDKQEKHLRYSEEGVLITK